MLVFSKIFINANLYIIGFIKKIINIIVIKPLTYFLALFKRIILNIIKKTYNILSYFKNFFKRMFNIKKNNENKKDFV